MDLIHIIDGLIGIVVMGCGWFLGSQARELKRVEILLNKTREDEKMALLNSTIGPATERLIIRLNRELASARTSWNSIDENVR